MSLLKRSHLRSLFLTSPHILPKSKISAWQISHLETVHSQYFQVVFRINLIFLSRLYPWHIARKYLLHENNNAEWLIIFQERYIQYRHLVKGNSEKNQSTRGLVCRDNPIWRILLLLAQKWWLIKDKCKRNNSYLC